MPALSSRRTVVLALAGALLVEALAVAPALGAEPRAAASGYALQVSTGTMVDPLSLPVRASLSARAQANARALRGKAGVRPFAATAPAGEVVSDGIGDAGDGVESAVLSVAAGISLLHTLPQLTSWDATGGMIGSRVVYGTPDRIYVDPHLPNNFHITNWENADFFDLPSSHWYWGATVSSSFFNGRWVAALPSFIGPFGGCTTGYINVAVSTTSDPVKPWTVYRISMGDAWSDEVRIGLSDTKVVFSTNRWDLDTGQPDCLGAPYEGARLTAVDWPDLLDGGTLTAQGVATPSTTNYFNFVPATSVPTAASTSAGSTVYLVGEKYVGSWGHVVFGTITGSAKAGTILLARNEDLTTSGQVSQLSDPPDTIAAFPSGNGFLDGRVASVTYRSGRLWFASTGSCQVPEDTALRACARYVHLNTGVTPATQIESAFLVDLERDTFLPLVGFARDGGAYFLTAASSAVAHLPIDELATFRSGGQPLVGGDSEVPIWEGESTYEAGDNYFGSVGSVMAVPNDAGATLAVYTATAQGSSSTSWATQLRGGQTGDPGGYIYKWNDGTGWSNGSNAGGVLRPSPSSPIRLMRYSASPATEDTGNGPRLTNGRDLPPLGVLYAVDLADPAIGGVPDAMSYTFYVQWQTWDGRWSTPVSSTVQVDPTPPVVSAPRFVFLPGTIGLTTPVRVTWTASDPQSGLGSITYFEERGEPTGLSFLKKLPGSATTIDRIFNLSAAYIWSVNVEAANRAAGLTTQGPVATVQFGSVGSAASITYTRTWSTASSSSYLGGSVRYATTAGATVTYSFSGRSIAFVTTRGPNRGKAEIWVDGVKKTTVDLYSSTTRYRQLVYQGAWFTKGSHTIMVKVLGTSGRPRVDFDSFLKAY